MIRVHYVIMGCGRVGSTLAIELADRGHSVAIIDQDPEAFSRLPEDFPGQQITGLGFDRAVLTEAGIEDAAGFAAVSNGDNSNIISARVVRETFGVTNVVARIYDPQRAAIYSRFGVPTVPTVSWTTQQVISRLLPMPAAIELSHPASGMAVLAITPPESWAGRSVAELEDHLSVRVCFIVRGQEGIVPLWNTILQDGDEVRVAAHEAERHTIDRRLADGPKESAQ